MRRTATSMLVSCGLLLGLAGCGGSTGATLSSGRVVEAASDTIFMSQANDTDTARLELGSTSIVVEPTRIVIDGQPVAKINASAKRVAVTRVDRKVKVIADGTTIYDAPISKAK